MCRYLLRNAYEIEGLFLLTVYINGIRYRAEAAVIPLNAELGQLLRQAASKLLLKIFTVMGERGWQFLVFDVFKVRDNRAQASRYSGLTNRAFF